MKNFTKAIALCLALLLCLTCPVGASAAEVGDATIDFSKTGSLTLYKIDLTNAEKDGVWDSSYVSTGVYDQDVYDANRKNRLKLGDSNITEAVQAEQNLLDVTALLNELKHEREPLLHCAVFLELKAKSPEGLQSLKTDLTMEITQAKLSVDMLTLRQKEGFLSVMPFGRNQFGTQFERVLPASSVSNMYPFNFSGKTDPHGFYIGRDRFGTNIIVELDRRADDKTTGSALILGNSGMGKSYLLKLLVTNLRESGKSIIGLDAEGEMQTLAQNNGGCYLDFLDGKYMINLLEPKAWASEPVEDPDAPEAFRRSGRISQHIAFLKDWFDNVEFILHNDTDGYFVIAELNEDDGFYYVTGHTTNESEATHLIPVKQDDGTGKVFIKGLEPDEYTATEVRTDDGYTLLKDDIKIIILGLTNLLKTDPDMGIVCTDSCECFDSNREYLRRRAVEESNPKVKALLEMDRDMLTRMQAEMANAREFYLVKRYTGLKPEMVFSQSNTTMKNISDNGFETERLDKEQIKRLLGIYFGTTMDGDKLPDVDGGQYKKEAADGTV